MAVENGGQAKQKKRHLKGKSGLDSLHCLKEQIPETEVPQCKDVLAKAPGEETPLRQPGHCLPWDPLFRVPATTVLVYVPGWVEFTNLLQESVAH